MSKIPVGHQLVLPAIWLQERARELAVKLRFSMALREWLTDNQEDVRVSSLGNIKADNFETYWIGSLEEGFHFYVRSNAVRLQGHQGLAFLPSEVPSSLKLDFAREMRQNMMDAGGKVAESSKKVAEVFDLDFDIFRTTLKY